MGIIIGITLFVVIGIYIIRYYSLSRPKKLFKKGDHCSVGDPHHPEYPKAVTVIDTDEDMCLCRFDDGKTSTLRQSDLTDQAF